MTRFAFAGKSLCGPFAAAASPATARLSSALKAMPPTQAMLVLRKNRRVCSSTAERRRNSSEFITSILVDHFIQIQNGIGHQCQVPVHTSVQLFQHGNLLASGRSERGDKKAPLELRFQIGPALSLHSPCQAFCGFKKYRAIEQIERLQWSIRANATDGAELAARGIKRHETRISSAAANESIDGAA